ncbi:TatD family hydrolase [Ferrimonas lipolytica]|uniref:TatD family hydrolase n=1 Tax=Ferrimonas lipolytica TaxID=2724191 RepID=A0A6H1UCH9_9GAMM|nr:TatD family hydrolase [Ferrimonas lipolytica]QIZ76548.1 TatD family hydrolase [Ferrimonas lipolytica]
MLIDSHCHLDRLIEGDDATSLKPVLDAAKQAGVEKMLCVSVSQKGYERMKQVVAPYTQVAISCGVHPLDVKDGYDKAWLAQHADDPQVVAIGETGLDYYYDKDNVAEQQQAFIDHIKVAKQLNKPVIIHTRDAKQDTLQMLREHGPVTGVLHCFTEDWAMAKEAIELGMYISISGIVTFKNAEQIRDVVRNMPLDRLLVETDSPYLAPVPYRGKSNQPAYVREVAQYVADLKQIRYEELCQITAANYHRLFPLAK